MTEWVNRLRNNIFVNPPPLATFINDVKFLTAKLPQQYGFEKVAVNPRFITNTAIHPVTGCTSLPVAACYRCETILNTEAAGIVVVCPVPVARYVAQLAV